MISIPRMNSNDALKFMKKLSPSKSFTLTIYLIIFFKKISPLLGCLMVGVYVSQSPASFEL